MARRPRLFAPGLLYHVIVRGNQRRKTFRCDEDYKDYLDRLEKYRAKFHVRIYAYCLMPNHVHLLVETGSTPLAKFMQGLQQSYTQHFNRSYRKVGHLFQGRYKAIICDRDKYLLTLVRYIHLNPVRAKLATRPERYSHSGHNSYLTNGTPKIVEVTPILKLLGGKKAYERFVLEGIGENHNEAYYAVEDQRFSGDFLERRAEGEETDRNCVQGNRPASGNDAGVTPRQGPALGYLDKASRGRRITGAGIWLRGKRSGEVPAARSGEYQ